MARTVLDSQLQLLDAQLLVMASSTEDALRMSIAALAARDAEAANAVIDGDDDIDRQEREVEGPVREAAAHTAARRDRFASCVGCP